jgi:2-iminobutanoate/2-iminopropanoate deaminase
MTREIIRTDDAPSSPLFSQGVKVGSTLYVSGMTGTDVSTGELAGESIQEQTKQSLRNCLAIVAAAGGDAADVAQITVLLARPEDFTGMNEEYAKVFATDPPARAVVKFGVALPGILISTMMTAYVEGS